MDVTLVLNPAARAGARTGVAMRTAERLRAGGVRVTMVSGGSAAETTALLRTALGLGTDAVVVAGGDGTVSLAIQELAGTGVPLGIVPVGTGNDLAQALGLRDLDADGAAAAVLAGRTRTIDLARAVRPDGSSVLYATVLAGGFDSRVNDRANRMQWPRGPRRYTVAILIEFLTLRGIPFDVDLELADGRAVRSSGDLIMATVGNGPSYGGGIPICPDADLEDGLLDVTLVRPIGRMRLLRLLPRVYRGTHTSLAPVETFRARRVRLSAPAVTAYADGEPLGSLPLEIQPAPRALRVFTRAAPPAARSAPGSPDLPVR
ncbi:MULTISPECIES: diacylglycerol kinase [unclassified Microbacterium]|uniref:diacylglycerol kinase n=1 Tax=unclassified Microbacterium TaxID=2609290 RepID=UPI00301A7D47